MILLASLLAPLPLLSASALQRSQDRTSDAPAATDAQESASAPPRPRVTKYDHDVLRSRDRSRLNPKQDPLEITGIDASDADFRARTPALARAHVQPMAVDQEELRERQIAMIEGGRTFTSPPRMYVPIGADDDAEPVRAPEVDEVIEEEPEEDGAPWLWLGVIAGAAVVVALVRRFR